MKNADKNRDPERAHKRARLDARCALRKLDLLDRLERWDRDRAEHPGALLNDLLGQLRTGSHPSLRSTRS